MAKRKKNSSDIKIRVGRRKVKAPWWVFVVLLLVAGVAVGAYFAYYAFHSKGGASSSSESTSQTISSSRSSSMDSVSSYSSAPGGTPLDVYAVEQSGKYGDCTLFKYGNYEILFDCGNTGSQAQLADVLSTYVSDHVLDLLVLTHPHTDHYGGVYGYKTASSAGGTLKDGGITSISKIVDNGADAYGTAYKNNWVNGIRSYYVSQGSDYQPIANVVKDHMYDAIWNLSGALSVQWLDTGNYPTVGSAGPSDANDGSISCAVKFGSYDFIMCGDLPGDPEKQIVSNYTGHSLIASGDTVVYKACHHCSDTYSANCTEFINFLNPKYAFSESGIDDANATSSGVVNAQHPYKAARNRIEAKTGKENFWWVGTAGTLKMSVPSDYSSFTIKGLGRKYGTYYYNGAIVDPLSEIETPFESTKWALSGY